MTTQSPHNSFSRRRFVGLLGTVSATAALAACSAGGAGSSTAQPIKFWNMPEGNAKFNPLDRKIVEAYKPKSGNGPATYRVVEWANFVATFATAVAANTGPAVSSGGGTQVFQYVAKDKIAFADHLMETWKSNGLYDDFVPGLLDALKTSDGHQAAIPQAVSAIVSWYSPSLLEKAGVKPPTDWQSYLDAAAGLKKIGVFGFGTGGGAGNFQGGQTLVSWMINNGGGLFDEDQQPNCVTPRNVEALDFVLEMIKKGYSDPRSTLYTTTNVAAQWKNKLFGLGWDVPTLIDNVGAGWDGMVGSPITGPHGDKGTLGFVNNIMMWKNTPSQKSSEAFLTYYYKNMAPLWTKGTMTALPPLKSIVETEEFQANTVLAKVAREWQPVLKTWAAPGKSMGQNSGLVDATTTISLFAQSVLGGRVTATEALNTLQKTLKASAKS